MSKSRLFAALVAAGFSTCATPPVAFGQGVAAAEMLPTALTVEQRNRFESNEFGGGHPSELDFRTEYMRCWASPDCRVDPDTGRFVLKDRFMFLDIHQDGGLVLWRDCTKGDLREVVTDAQVSHSHCVDTQGKRIRGGRGGPTVAQRIAERVDPLEKSLNDLGVRMTQVEADNIIRDEAIVTAVEAARMSTEAAGNALDAATIASQTATTALTTADEAKKMAFDARTEAIGAVELGAAAVQHGPLIEGYVLAGVVPGAPIIGPDGSAIRHGTLGGGGVGIDVGVDAAKSRTVAFGEVLLGGDGNPSTAWAVGLEWTHRVSDGIHVGPHVAYGERYPLLSPSTIGRQGLAGATLAIPVNHGSGGGHLLAHIRASIGPESLWVDGMEEGAVRLAGRLTVGCGFGTGALNQ